MSQEFLIICLTYAPGIFFTSILGLCFGGYSTMAAYRLPRNERWFGLKPRCLHCNHVLYLKDFMPIISYFWNKNKCKYCGGPIENQLVYLFVEVATLILCVLCFLQFDFSELYLLTTGLVVTAVVIVATDVDKHFIADKSITLVLLFGIIYRVLLDGTIYNMLYGVFGFLIAGMIIRHLYFFFHKNSTDGNDYLKFSTDNKFSGAGFQYVKLLTATGAWIGVELSLLFAFIVTLLIYLLLTYMVMKISKAKEIPFSIPIITALLCSVMQ
ncbi:MAG: prepilin peptidase [Pseudomonadota bacterium]